jgi:uncharacterized protein (DUF58 family)
MPELKDILKKVHQIEIRSKRLTNHLFSGEYHSAFKGRGMSFKEVREYAPGDDIRFIDWNVSARFGHPFSKVFEEERELTVMLLLDISRSTSIGTRSRTKQDLITEMAAVLAFSAISNNDKVGAILFTDRMEKFIPAAKGKEHVLYIVRQMLSAEPKGAGTNIQQALRFMQQTTKHSAITFLFSDFESQGFEKMMKAAAVRHDCIAVQTFDQSDITLPRAALLPVQDAETGAIQWMDTQSQAFQQGYQAQKAKALENTRQAIVASGWDYLRFRTDHDYVRTLQQFFLKRIRK